jgi:hypothetical protein
MGPLRPNGSTFPRAGGGDELMFFVGTGILFPCGLGDFRKVLATSCR